VTRNTLYDAIDWRVFANSSTIERMGNFVFLMISKSFVFSIFFAGLKQVFYEDLHVFSYKSSKIVRNLIGDYLIFLLSFIFKLITGYIFYEYKYLCELDREIIQRIRQGLNSFKGNLDLKIDEEKKIEDLTKEQIEAFYSFFKKDVKIIFLNKIFITEIKEKFYMQKIELINRDVYLIVEKPSKYKKKD